MTRSIGATLLLQGQIEDDLETIAQQIVDQARETPDADEKALLHQQAAQLRGIALFANDVRQDLERMEEAARVPSTRELAAATPLRVTAFRVAGQRVLAILGGGS